MFRYALALRGCRATLVALVLFAIAHEACAGSEHHSASVRSGTVIINGQLVEGPFIVDAVGSEVTVNGIPVGHISRDSATASPFADEPVNAAIADVERLLLLNGLLLCHGQTVLMLPGFESSDAGTVLTTVIGTLTSDASPEDRLLQLATYDFPATRHMTTKRWMELIGLVQTNADIKARVINCCDAAVIDPFMVAGLNDAIPDDGIMLTNEPAVTEPVDISESVQYGVNLFGMLAGVVALGSLLSSRPDTDRQWREVNGSVAAMKLVTRCGGLIILLGLFDLICTLMAIQTGMFRELNPLASQLTASPLAVVFFKLAAMTVGVGLLWRLRQYSGAQTAAWWMCLVCTLVVFRWLTFHSMFIA